MPELRPWSSQQLSQVQAATLEAIRGPGLRGKDGPMRKIGYELAQLHVLHQRSIPLTPENLRREQLAGLSLRAGDDKQQMVLVDATAAGDVDALWRRMAQLGGRNLSAYAPIVSGWMPVASLAQLAASSTLQLARPSRAMARAGVVTSQGDLAIRGPAVRPPAQPGGPTGAGVSVGVISDSYNCLGGANLDVSNGELPHVGFVQEVSDCFERKDEGRAMMQIVADVAPDATLMFASGWGGIATFANAVTTLANQQAKVIVDDLWSYASPWFQDGVINAAVNDAVLNHGAAYFSAAGNNAMQSYESPFRPSTTVGNGGGLVHDFDSTLGEDVLSLVYIPSGQTATVLLQWDQPFVSACTGCPGSASDLDVYFVSAFDGSTVGVPGIDPNEGGDAFEIATFTNSGPDDYFLFVVEHYSGPAPQLLKLVYTNQYLDYEDVNFKSTALGPGQSANAIAVGAAEFYETPACDTPVPQLAPFSSRGGAPTLFSPGGVRLATPEVRQKPELVAPQNGNTSFFGIDIPSQPGGTTRSECLDSDVYPNFQGTSAAAPHAAGVAALLRQARPDLTPQRVYDAMKTGAVDMMSPGFDFDSGFGLLQADAAMSHLGPRFNDVPADYWAYTFIERLAAAGVTSGCGGGDYCPLSQVTRAQMAVFLERGIHGSDFRPPAAKGNVFLDVGATDFAASFIEQLAADGITSGCGSGKYCPNTNVTRDQMAVFLLRAKYGAGYSPPPPSGVFADVPTNYWAARWIERLAAEGITAGCGGGNYCPTAPVNRDQMAVFLVRTFGL